MKTQEGVPLPSENNPDGSVNFKEINFWGKPTEEVIKEVHQEHEDVWGEDPTATPVAVMEEDEKRLAAIRAAAERERVRQEYLLKEQEQKNSLYQKIRHLFDSKNKAE